MAIITNKIPKIWSKYEYLCVCEREWHNVFNRGLGDGILFKQDFFLEKCKIAIPVRFDDPIVFSKK